MEHVVKIFYISVFFFLIEALMFNFIFRNYPKIPGDIYIDKPGIRVYIPFTSVIILTILIYFLIGNYLKL